MSHVLLILTGKSLDVIHDPSALALPGGGPSRPAPFDSSRRLLMDDIEAIKQLKARYCRTMDTKDWAGMRRVFTDDVTMDTVASGGSVMTGADDFLTFLVE